jgi:hypothetical protein
MQSRYLAIVLISAVFFSAICLFPSTGSAYCVYNHVNANFSVCGENCSKCFKSYIKSGHHGCCPGGHKGCGGHTYITFYPYESNITSDFGWYAPVQVTNHGWVSFFGKCKGSMYHNTGFNPDYCADVTVKVHNNDGDVIYHGGVYPVDNSWSLRAKCQDD